jgi:hypothetical protein
LKEVKGGWNILVNRDVLKNSEDESYFLGSQGFRMLSIYEKEYEGVIPLDTYLILGNLSGGSVDSTRYGLVNKVDILGKAEIE